MEPAAFQIVLMVVWANIMSAIFLWGVLRAHKRDDAFIRDKTTMLALVIPIGFMVLIALAAT